MSVQQSPPVPTGRRERVRFYLLDHETPIGKAIDIALLVLNIAFIAVFVAQTYPVSTQVRSVLWGFEVLLAVIFGVEYILRLYGAKSRYGEATDPYTVVDLLSILPTFALLLVPGSVIVQLGFLRALRVIRVLRFYRFTQDAEFFFGTIGVSALRVLKLGLTVFVIFFTSAGLFYSVELQANPGISHFGDAFYYIVIALATVGFGDIVPTTVAGRWVTVGAVLTAIILVPRQAGAIIRTWTHKGEVEVTCPNCGLQYHDQDASHCKACGHVIYHEHDSRE
ncbi:ion transporter [Halodesulfurarchaeum sp. HSR-GB]|uniref:ion transporter n=1 Tax=Halodesulfurarchaeum sp. HSR-GB TaxID=3074077 RepID=UPI00286312B3|nr:ion transporter [Halodesulfurarchaeum sp. HSR-GB]MDR5655747.1 ion transporter [Halodesulfurarchaeum sp. HSR-GB]